MSADKGDKQLPKSMRHRQILDLAEENPDASVDELASMVPSATADLVEHVFDKHGDPAAEDESSTNTEPDMSSTTESTSSPDDSDAETGATDDHQEDRIDEETPDSESKSDIESDADAGRYPSVGSLSERKRELLEVVAAHPKVTQQTIADHFDVTSATVSRWATEIEGFEWSERESFIDAVFDDPPSFELDRDSVSAETTASEASHTDSVASTEENDTTEMAVESTLNRLEERVTDLEESQKEETGTDSVFEDPELVHKVVHACMVSEKIDESEELRILRALLE